MTTPDAAKQMTDATLVTHIKGLVSLQNFPLDADTSTLVADTLRVLRTERTVRHLAAFDGLAK